MRTKTPNLHILLPLGQMTVKERVDLAKQIMQLGPQSQLYQGNPHIQAAVGEVSTFGTQLGTADGNVGGLEAQLVLSKEVRATTLNKFDKSMGVLTSLLENSANTPDEAAAMGFINSRIGKAPRAPLAPPDGIIVKLGKKHGQFRVSAKTTSRHERFGAQVSTDPVGPATWQDLAGSGKARLVTGHASGGLVWVRFRTSRGNVQSDWCAAVPVTVP